MLLPARVRQADGTTPERGRSDSSRASSVIAFSLFEWPLTFHAARWMPIRSSG
jgi:hypothetical protein